MKSLMLSILITAPLFAGTIFVGLEGSTPATQTSDLDGFPDVTWTSGFSFDVSGAAATPDGDVYICNGAFSTDLYITDMTGNPPVFLSTISVDISGLAYGRSTLYGYSNYASPKGIYSIDPNTGNATLVLDIYTGTGFRFFALDYNQEDDLFYGYTEYGNTGLYSIDIDTGDMIKIADPFPASNSSARAMAVGNNTVYLLATRGDDGVDCYAYDLSQGQSGEWVAFTQPYPQYHSTGGAAFISDQTDVTESNSPFTPVQLMSAHPNPFTLSTTIEYTLATSEHVTLDIIDISGRIVETPIDETQSAGAHSIIFSAEGYPGGVYLYRLMAGSTCAQVRCMVLVE